MGVGGFEANRALAGGIPAVLAGALGLSACQKPFKPHYKIYQPEPQALAPANSASSRERVTAAISDANALRAAANEAQ
jgi:hypothetical protein